MGLGAGAAALLLPAPVFAHAFGQTFVLPLPVWLYLYGGASAVIVSFILIALFTSPGVSSLSYPRHEISEWPLVRAMRRPGVVRALHAMSAAAFLVLIVAALVGKDDPTHNLTSVFVWIFVAIGFAYASAVVGDFWAVVNPFRIFAGSWGGTPRFRYPPWLGYLPAILFFYYFIWLELLTGGAGAAPRTLVFHIGCYYTICLAGSALFGNDAWFHYADFLSVFFRLLSRISIVEYRDGRVYLRPPFVGLLTATPDHGSLVVFILLMLSSTAFDGFRETIAWSRFAAMLPRPDVAIGGWHIEIIPVVVLLISPGLFFACYLAAVWAMKRLLSTSVPVTTLVRQFAFSLIPIALAYHVAHYFTLLAIQGQSIAAIVSDPFGRGWNLFHTASWIPNVGLLSATAVWHTQVAAILIGHIASVYLAHCVALHLFPSPRQAVRSQIPMLVLMVAYTLFGLWILSQPLSG